MSLSLLRLHHVTLSPTTSPRCLQVVTRICEVAHRTRLLVVDRETDEYLRSQDRACTEDLAIEMGTLSPRPSPTPCGSPIPRENSPLTLKLDNKHFRFLAAESPPPRTPQGEVQRTEQAGSGTDTEVRLT